ncbi:MAG: SMC-Scp complex subunit ScpB [Thermoleophilia bacterium]|nr:SMC-Scp complex subunit ScpB [Thermoleophilia bacterium]
MDDQDTQEFEGEDETDNPAEESMTADDSPDVVTGEQTESVPDESASTELVADSDEIANPDTADTAVLEPSDDATPDAAGLAIPDTADIVRDIEAILFIAPDPVSLEVFSEVTGTEGEALAHAVESVREKYSDPDSGITFAEIAGGYTFRTGDFAREAVERFCRRPVDYSLSPAAMETLAIVAYLQPITRPEIARIRGVGADTVVANLLDKGLVAEAGRAQQTGAVKYRTTEAFEKLFGLAEMADLPSLEGFEATPADVEELREKLHLAADKRQ